MTQDKKFLIIGIFFLIWKPLNYNHRNQSIKLSTKHVLIREIMIKDLMKFNSNEIMIILSLH